MRLAVRSGSTLLALVLTAATAASPAAAQAPDSALTVPDTVALPPVSVDPVTGEVATDPAPTYRSLDARVARAVYRADAPPFVGVMRAVNETSLPLFALAAPVAAGAALAGGDGVRPALRLLASEAGALGVVYALKGALRRPRPYRTMTELAARDRRHAGAGDPADPYSFPSGHAALSFSVATSLTMSDRRWAAPAMAWATAVSVSRVWHGVHYPSDVLAGAAVGAGSAVVVGLLLPSGEGAEATAFRVVVPF